MRGLGEVLEKPEGGLYGGAFTTKSLVAWGDAYLCMYYGSLVCWWRTEVLPTIADDEDEYYDE